ncbi:MAG: hypothetical protein A4S12_04585 [Proteobacteria bacterium SG_bin5]|nr:MAG: hypothetical protein A4S12_04585 [Proteobacteria bacterium SG_bin5]
MTNGSGIRVVMDGSMDAYMAAADETLAELLVSDSVLVAALREYDSFFRTRLFTQGPAEPIALVLFMNAYQLFLAGARMALSGHCAAVFPLLRTALESAAYGGLIARNPALSEVWAGRHRGDAEKKACRKSFTFEKAISPLEDRAPDIHALAVLGYEGEIDYGAHPNIKGVFGHVSLNDQREDGCKAVTHTSLYGSAHIETIRGLCACLDFGFAIIGIIAPSGPTISDNLVDGLQSLNDAKNTAVAPYQSPNS